MNLKSIVALVFVLAGLLLCGTLLNAADTLDIYVIDVEGGKAQIVKTPFGQAVLIDAGFPGRDDRDLKRIEVAAKAAGVTAFDYVIVTHYDIDHAGNIPAVAARFPIGAFVDHGAMIADPKMNSLNKKSGEDYLAFVADKKRLSVKPGDVIPLKGVTVTVLTSGENALTRPLSGAGQPNTSCPAAAPEAIQYEDNSGSVGELWQFGAFRMADFGDLLKWVENRLVCPANQVGRVDLFVSNHHGVAMSNSPELIASLRPKVVIVNNGERKGNAVETQQTFHSTVGLQDVWQVHKSTSIPAKMNPPENFIANLTATDDHAYWIKISARTDGTFTVTNGRNDFAKTYK
jgi:beta-lactamase superfamily II metal-dependent hydrolase